MLLHELDAVGAVRAGAGEHHHNGVLLFLLRQGGEENVDGMVQRDRGVVRQDQLSALDGHELLWRDQVDGVRLDGHAVFRLVDLHLRVLAQDVGHQALVVGREVLHHHEAQSAVGRHTAEKLLQRLQAARGGADADDQGGLFRARTQRRCLVRMSHMRSSLCASCRSRGISPRRYFSANTCAGIGRSK